MLVLPGEPAALWLRQQWDWTARARLPPPAGRVARPPPPPPPCPGPACRTPSQTTDGQGGTTRPRRADVPDRMTTGIATAFILSVMVASWHLTDQPWWRRGRFGTLSCNPALAKHHCPSSGSQHTGRCGWSLCLRSFLGGQRMLSLIAL